MKKSSPSISVEQSILPPLARVEAAEEASDVIRRTADFLRERTGVKNKGSNKENVSEMKIPHIKQSKSMDAIGDDNVSVTKRSKSASDRTSKKNHGLANVKGAHTGGHPLKGKGARPFSAPLGRDAVLR